MKLRIEDNSLRFRISPEELERLNDEGRLESVTQLYNEEGVLDGEFIYALALEREFGPTRCHIAPSFILFILHPGDLALLNARRDEGFEHRHAAITPDGEVKVFTATVEVDRHA